MILLLKILNKSTEKYVQYTFFFKNISWFVSSQLHHLRQNLDINSSNLMLNILLTFNIAKIKKKSKICALFCLKSKLKVFLIKKALFKAVLLNSILQLIKYYVLFCVVRNFEFSIPLQILLLYGKITHYSCNTLHIYRTKILQILDFSL